MKQIQNIGNTFIIPLNLYSQKVSSVEELKDGDTVAIPDDLTNGGRALKVLEAAGLIDLKDSAGFNPTVDDIESYNVNITIREIEAAQLTQALPGIAMAVINGNYALQGGLNAGSDALAIEAADGDAAQEYGNILAVKEGHENDPAILALIDVLHSDTIRDYINNTYSGAVVPTF